MTYEPIKRNRYSYSSRECSYTGSNFNQDFDEFHLPVSRLVLSNLHEWGIAQGLEVGGTTGSNIITINPGVAIDTQGRLISLAANGSGAIGKISTQRSFVPFQLNTSDYQQPQDTTYYLTIEFNELELSNQRGRPCDRVLEQVPWIRLQPVSGDGAYVNDGTSVVLGQAVIDSEGKLKELKPDGRRLVGKTVEQLNFQRAGKVADQVKQVSAAKIKPATSGGLQITVSEATDQVLLQKEGGGNFAQLAVQANTLDVTGNVKASGELQGNSLQLSAGATMNGPLTIQNALTVSSNVDIGGNLKVSGNLEVQGNVIARDTEHIAGNVSLGDVDNDEVKITGVVRSGHSSGALRVDDALHTTGLLTIDGNVGIGTINPAAGLEINKGATNDLALLLNSSGPGWGSGLMLKNTASGGKSYGIYSGWGTLHFADVDNAVDRMAITKDGNIGIGTNQPQGKLDVGGDIRAGNSDIYFTKTDHEHTQVGNQEGYAAIENAKDYGALMILGRAYHENNVLQRRVKLWDYLQVNGKLEVTDNLTVSKDLFINGNVGIGTTNPKAKLHISSSSDTNVLSRIEAGNTGGWAEIDLYSTYDVENRKKWNMAARGSGGFAIRQLTDSRGELAIPFFINTDGNVGIGSSTPKEKLEVSGNIKATGTISCSRLILRNEYEFSKTSIVKDQEEVKVPWGTTVDWNIFVSPRYGGIEEPGAEEDNAVIAIKCYAEEKPDKTGWKITIKFKVRHSDDCDGYWEYSPSNVPTANYLLIPR